MAEDPQVTPPAEAPSEAPGPLEAIADVAMAPVQEAMHATDRWLRWAMAAQLLCASAAGLVAWWLNLHDWQAYLALGACVTVLIGNFQRWPIGAGPVRRAGATGLSLFTSIGWSALLLDRAMATHWQDAVGHVVQQASWFWLPALLQILSFGFLIAHAWVVSRDGRVPPRPAPAQTPPPSSPSRP